MMKFEHKLAQTKALGMNPKFRSGGSREILQYLMCKNIVFTLFNSNCSWRYKNSLEYSLKNV